MRINNNISAMNTYSRLNSANNAKSGSLAKLSSGLRINKAGDDAAGLAISEKMRGQIGGLKQSVRNAQDGISLIQTAEGALSETHSILNRMRELAVQSSNDTNTAEDRAEIQKEVDQLSQEMSRIGKNTEFNTQTLLNGTLNSTFHIGANSQQNLKLEIGDMRGKSLGVAGAGKFEQTKEVEGIEADLAVGTYTVDGTDLKDEDGVVVATTTDQLTWTLKDNTGTVEDFTFDEEVNSGNIVVTKDNVKATVEFQNDKLEAGNYTVTATDIKDANGKVIATGDGDNYINSAGDAVASFKATIAKETKVSVGGVDVSSRETSDAAITTIDSAIQRVSAERSKLGATQNRLDHTINNLTATAENLSEAESRIRDVDMAEEMMDFTKNNILSQAATSMLAQANQMPQSVLQLLQ